MEEHIVKILETAQLTHDVKRFRVEKPRAYSFVPGQATEVFRRKEPKVIFESYKMPF